MQQHDCQAQPHDSNMSRDQQKDAPQNHESPKRPQQEAYQFLDTPPSQTWRTFLRNHLGEIGTVDFFTVSNDTYASAVRFLHVTGRRRPMKYFPVGSFELSSRLGEI